MDYRELPAFMQELRDRGGAAPSALQFTILTAVRSSEALGARWDEFDFENKAWTIPPWRMKQKRTHVVPLTEAMVELLRSLPTEEDNPFVFIGTGANKRDSLTHNCMLVLLGRMKRRDITVHGFRSSFRTWASERTAFPDHIAEMCLAHNVGSAVERIYKRTDLLEKRRRLMEAWSTYCSTPNATSEGTVVPLRAEAAR